MVDAANLIKKLIIVQYKLIRKPMNAHLLRFFKARHQDGQAQSRFQKALVRFGQFSHVVECRIDQQLVKSVDSDIARKYIDKDSGKQKLIIKPLSDKRAHQQALKYITKGIFVYGGAMALAYLEIQRKQAKKDKKENELKQMRAELDQILLET